MRSRRRKALRSPTTASRLIETDEEEDNEKVDSLLSFIGFVFAIVFAVPVLVGIGHAGVISDFQFSLCCLWSSFALIINCIILIAPDSSAGLVAGGSEALHSFINRAGGKDEANEANNV